MRVSFKMKRKKDIACSATITSDKSHNCTQPNKGNSIAVICFKHLDTFYGERWRGDGVQREMQVCECVRVGNIERAHKAPSCIQCISRTNRANAVVLLYICLCMSNMYFHVRLYVYMCVFL